MTRTATSCKRDFHAALNDLLNVFSVDYFLAPSADPAVRTQQRCEAKDALAAVMERLTAAMAHPDARFALPADEVRALGPLFSELGALLETMGVAGAKRAASRSAMADIIPLKPKPLTVREITNDLFHFREVGKRLRR